MLTQWTYFQFTTQEFSMVGGYTEEVGRVLARGWALAWDNTVHFVRLDTSMLTDLHYYFHVFCVLCDQTVMLVTI